MWTEVLVLLIHLWNSLLQELYNICYCSVLNSYLSNIWCAISCFFFFQRFVSQKTPLFTAFNWMCCSCDLQCKFSGFYKTVGGVIESSVCLICSASCVSLHIPSHLSVFCWVRSLPHFYDYDRRETTHQLLINQINHFL